MPRSGWMGTVLLVALALPACSPDDSATTTTSPITTTTRPPVTTTTKVGTSSTAAATTTTETQGDTVTVLLARTGEMGPEWTEQVFPYGQGEDTLGTSPGGEGLMLGPEYGVQTADGTWWFMDAAKMRFAHFAEDGTYLGEAVFPPEILTQGIYFQYQMPQALDDGTIVASGFRGEASQAILTFADGMFTSTTIDSSVPWATSDGNILYGFSAADGSPQSLDPSDGTTAEVEWFLARDGSRYMISLDGSEITIALPDAGITKTVLLRFAETPDTEVFAGIEVASTEDGSLHVLAYGSPVSDESLEVGGVFTVTADGRVGAAEPIVSPFSASDPGSPAHLGARPGSDDVWYMVVGTDGVRVFSPGRAASGS